jgi:hypothetical protein
MPPIATLDVSELDFESWLRFFFDRPPLAAGESFTGRFCADVECVQPAQPRRIVMHLEMMCTRFADIGQRYSLESLNQGLWGMFGIGNFELQASLWNDAVPLDGRLACIRSMRIPYLDFVAGHKAEVMENAFDMWWDMLLNSFWSGHRRHHAYDHLDPADKAILDTAFETLDAVLGSADERCQGYALHGLGHLHHPAVAERVGRFIAAHAHDLTSDELAWLEQCRDGTVM